MPYKITEELKSLNELFYSFEEAKNALIDDNFTFEESIALFDEVAYPVWVDNRDSLLNTINNIVLEWDEINQVLTRTIEFESEQLYFEYRAMTNSVFPYMNRILEVKSVE